MVLDERINRPFVGREEGYHIWLCNNDLPIEDVIVGVVAMVHHKGEIHHKACGVPVAVGASIRLVGRQTVVGQKLIFILAIDDDATTGAFHLGSDVNPSTDEVNLLVLNGIWINREPKRCRWPVWVLRILLTAVQKGQGCY